MLASNWTALICVLSQATDKDILDLFLSVLDSPYANHLIRQFVLCAITKMASRHTTTAPQQARIVDVLAQYTTNPELELQQRAVEFASLFTLGDLKVGVLERMPPPELKATVMGVGTFCQFSEDLRTAYIFYSQRKQTSGFYEKWKRGMILSEFIVVVLTQHIRVTSWETILSLLPLNSMGRQCKTTKISWLRSSVAVHLPVPHLNQRPPSRRSHRRATSRTSLDSLTLLRIPRPPHPHRDHRHRHWRSRYPKHKYSRLYKRRHHHYQHNSSRRRHRG